MKRVFWFLIIGVALGLYATTTAAQAQATRTWVSGVGDDANPCSRTAPCKTFAGAISKTAECGEIDVLDPGGFGTVTITKGITIDGGGGEAGQVASVLAVSVPGITVNVSSSLCQKVILRNLDINGVVGYSGGSGTIGVNILAAQAVSVENVNIMNFSQYGVDLHPSTHANLSMYNSNIENSTLGGIDSVGLSGTNRVVISRSTIHHNGVGLTVGANTDVDTLDSSFVQNSGGGVLANASTSRITMLSSVLSNNQVFGVHSTNSAIVQLSNCTVANNNGTGVLADLAGQILTWSNNYVGGNTIDGARTGTIVPF
jgi:hypothetical protein